MCWTPAEVSLALNLSRIYGLSDQGVTNGQHNRRKIRGSSVPQKANEVRSMFDTYVVN